MELEDCMIDEADLGTLALNGATFEGARRCWISQGRRGCSLARSSFRKGGRQCTMLIGVEREACTGCGACVRLSALFSVLT